jgi:hypothetical protein
MTDRVHSTPPTAPVVLAKKPHLRLRSTVPTSRTVCNPPSCAPCGMQMHPVRSHPQWHATFTEPSATSAPARFEGPHTRHQPTGDRHSGTYSQYLHPSSGLTVCSTYGVALPAGGHNTDSHMTHRTNPWRVYTQCVHLCRQHVCVRRRVSVHPVSIKSVARHFCVCTARGIT